MSLASMAILTACLQKSVLKGDTAYPAYTIEGCTKTWSWPCTACMLLDHQRSS